MLCKKWIDCTCSSVEHTLRFLYFDDEKNVQDHDLYIDVYLENYKWYKRIWKGIKYIFGYRSRYGHFTEIIYDVEKVKELQDFLDAYFEAVPFDVAPKEKKENEWFWYQKPSGASVYNSKEDYQGFRPAKNLIEGSEIIIQHLILGFIRARVRKESNIWFAEDEDNLYTLFFCEERKCWVSSMAMNKKAIKVIKNNIKPKSGNVIGSSPKPIFYKNNT